MAVVPLPNRTSFVLLYDSDFGSSKRILSCDRVQKGQAQIPNLG